MSDTEPPSYWPAETRDVYEGLQTYRIVGASACVDAIMRALGALVEHLAIGNYSGAYQEVSAAGARFCALKPSTAAYANAVYWLLSGLDAHADVAAVRRQVIDRVERYTAYRRQSLARIVAEGSALLPPGSHVLLHDFSSTVLAIVEECGRRNSPLTVFVTAGEPVQQGPKVARAVGAAGHRVIYLPDSGIGRVMIEVDIVLSGVETLFRNGDLANTVGTYPMALVARDAGVPLYGVTERMKIHATKNGAMHTDLTARVLHPWPSDADVLPADTEVRREVLDLTPAALVAGYVTEEGFVRPRDVSGAFERLYRELASGIRAAF